MSDTNVTPLRPKDPTNALRSKRYRDKRKSENRTTGSVSENASDFNASATVATPELGQPAVPKTVVDGSPLRERLAVVAAVAIGCVAIAATALSLSDLAESIGEVAHVPLWKSYALAVTLDLNFIATEAFSLFVSAAVSLATRRATTATKVITLTMSGVANAWAMSHTVVDPVTQAACIAAGCAVPALVALATYTLGRAVRA